MVLDLRVADRSEKDGVELRQLIGAVFRHHLAVLEVVVRVPRKLCELPFDAVFGRYGLQHLESLFDNIDADSVTWYHRNFVHSFLIGPPLFAGTPLIGSALVYAGQQPTL